MTITDWNQKPFTSKTFSHPYHPISNNFIDYMDAWYNMFYLQSYQHSWFIQFSRNCNTQFPAWFQKWWTFFGLLDSIFPPDIQEKFEFYKKKTSSQPITQPRLLTFCSRLRIPWILTWNFIKKQEQPHPFPLSLSREFNIKWWDKFNHDFVSSLAAATDLEQYRQELLQTLKQFDDQQENEETKEIVISDDSFVDLEIILYGGPMGQSR
ncbi:hypothetical protein PVL29_026132 [Vitis rotundifolia]|uniref:Uncharacterized protein n=1 Tax=Vitis rotundifolia TaxID=103349 RepID=A0AA38YLQ7_VITRO|nr:hypothetical protein PVL29_026132 [Vitis rotundifolia]